jgi:TolB-like protein
MFMRFRSTNRFAAVFSAIVGLSVCAPLWAAPAPAGKVATTDTKMNIAVITLKNAAGVSGGESEILSDRLRAELFNTGKVNVMERDQMQEILKEQGFQASGACTDEACLVQMGQMLGVERLITGSIGKLGSMFMVNLRAIDVSTGRIAKAVSRDINGGIEEVVVYLRGIAKELVTTGPAADATAVQTESEHPEVQQASQAEEPKVEEPEEKPEVEQPAEEEKPVESASAGKDSRKEKNKNRFGIHLGFNLTPGEHYEYMRIKYYDEFGLQDGYYSGELGPDDSLYSYNYTDYTPTPGVGVDLKFMLKAGPILTVDIGFNLEWANGISMEWLYNDMYSTGTDTIVTLDHNTTIFGFTVGPTFVKRWHPIKMNIGVLVGFNYLKHTEVMEWTEKSPIRGETSLDNSEMTTRAFAISGAARAGVEFLIGKHIGINADFMVRYLRSRSLLWAETSFESGRTREDKRVLQFPLFVPGVGVNFYF